MIVISVGTPHAATLWPSPRILGDSARSAVESGRDRRLALVEIFGGLVSAIVAGVGTVLVVSAIVLVAGIVIVSRRRARPQEAIDAVRRRAGSALVRADDRVDAATTDLDFALAQFGERETADYHAALSRAREDRAELFRLHRMLEEEPGANLRHRDRADRIVMLADRIDATLTAEAARFRDRRTVESGAAARLRSLTERILTARELASECATERDALREQFVARALGEAATAPERALALLDRADALAAEAQAELSLSAASAVNATVADAERLAHDAEAMLALVPATATRLRDAITALEALRADGRTARTEALATLDEAPDAETAAAITAAVAETDAAIAAAAPGDARDPVPALDGIRTAMDQLEVALAASRTQAQRLAHAREAYAGARVSAQSQLAAARAALGRGGSAGARARLAEAEEELALAERSTDPVEALDAARRAITHARDAEVLAP